MTPVPLRFTALAASLLVGACLWGESHAETPICDDASLGSGLWLGRQAAPPSDYLARLRAAEQTAGSARARETSGRHEQLDEVPLPQALALHRGGEPICTGTLVASAWVLTAAHCLPVDRVTVGRSAGCPAAERRVARAVPHPDPTVDAALLALDEPISGLPPVLLNTLPLPTLPPPLDVVLVGFGTAARRLRGLKTWARFSVGVLACDRLSARLTGCLPEGEVLMPPIGGIDTCTGDSGGPLLGRVDGEWRLFGVVSRGRDGGANACGSGGIYVRADVLVAWQMDELKDSNEPRGDE